MGYPYTHPTKTASDSRPGKGRRGHGGATHVADSEKSLPHVCRANASEVSRGVIWQPISWTTQTLAQLWTTEREPTDMCCQAHLPELLGCELRLLRLTDYTSHHGTRRVQPRLVDVSYARRRNRHSAGIALRIQ